MQISNYGFSNIARQRHPLISMAFAVEDEISGSPIDIVQFEGCDFTATKPESRKQNQDGEVTATNVGAAVTTLEKLLKLSSRNELG